MTPDILIEFWRRECHAILVPGCRPDGLNLGLMAGIPPGCTIFNPEGTEPLPVVERVTAGQVLGI
jgi:hypothetical protein